MNKKKRELQHNELVDVIGSHYEKIKPHMPKIIMFSTVAVLGVLAIAFWLYSRQSIQESQWREYFVSSRFADSRGMVEVAAIFPDTTVGQLALLNAGDADFATGFESVIRNRDTFQSRLEEATGRYEKIVNGSSKANPFARLRASYALAYCYESLGRFSEAQELYKKIIDDNPDTPEAMLASRSLERVTNPQLTSILAAFREWEPQSEAPGMPSMLPQRPDISMPTELPVPPAEIDESLVPTVAGDDDAENTSTEDGSGEAGNDEANSGDSATGEEKSGDTVNGKTGDDKDGDDKEGDDKEGDDKEGDDKEGDDKEGDDKEN